MRVNIDYVPTIPHIDSEDESVLEVVEQLNITLTKLNEILRKLGTSINMVELGSATRAENVFCEWIPVTFGVAGTELSASHTLGKVPTAIIGSQLSTSGDIFWSSPATTTQIFLTATTNSLSGTIIIV